MEMHQIRYFLALSETLNFTRAAEACNVAQPSLTRAIKKLEEEFGQDLIRRERSNSHLTEFGRTMLPALRQTYESAEAARKLALSFKKEERASLGIALSHTVDMSLVSPFLAELTRALSGLDVKMFRGDADAVVESMKDGSVELAIAGPLGDDWDRFDVWPLFTERFVLVVPQNHALANSKAVSLKALAGSTVLARPYCEHRAAYGKLLESSGVRESANHDVPSDRDIIALVEAGLGVAVIPASTPHPADVCRIELQETALSRTVSLFSVAGRQRSSAAHTLMKFLRAADWASKSPALRPA